MCGLNLVASCCVVLQAVTVDRLLLLMNIKEEISACKQGCMYVGDNFFLVLHPPIILDRCNYILFPAYNSITKEVRGTWGRYLFLFPACLFLSLCQLALFLINIMSIFSDIEYSSLILLEL